MPGKKASLVIGSCTDLIASNAPVAGRSGIGSFRGTNLPVPALVFRVLLFRIELSPPSKLGVEADIPLCVPNTDRSVVRVSLCES